MVAQKLHFSVENPSSDDSSIMQVETYISLESLPIYSSDTAAQVSPPTSSSLVEWEMSGSLKYKAFSKASLFDRARRQSYLSVSTTIISQGGNTTATSPNAVASSDGTGNIKSPSFSSCKGATSSGGTGTVVSQVAATSSGGTARVSYSLLP